MGAFEWPGFFIALFWVGIISIFLANKVVPRGLKNVFYLAVFIRISGVLIYHFVAFNVYSGAADGVIYYRYALLTLERLSEAGLQTFTNPVFYRGGSFLGTNFVAYYGSLFVLMCGESYRGTFLLANFLGFTGLLLMLKTFLVRYPQVNSKKFAIILLTFPSLWFWAASISKEVVILFGLGLAVYYYYAKPRNSLSSILGTAIGLAIITTVRPQVLLVVLIAMLLPEVLGKGKVFSFRNIAIVLVAIVGFGISTSFLGLQETSIEAFEEKLIEDRRYNAYGGSVIAEEEPLTLSQAHIALINFLFRPFPWEISSFTNMISALEILLIYLIVYLNFKSFKTSLQHIRSDKLLMMSLVFIVLYSIAGGLTAVNLGLIARVRIFVYPFLFILVFAHKLAPNLPLTKLNPVKYRKRTLRVI